MSSTRCECIYYCKKITKHETDRCAFVGSSFVKLECNKCGYHVIKSICETCRINHERWITKQVTVHCPQCFAFHRVSSFWTLFGDSS